MRTDVFSKRKRSEVMSLIRSRGNIATELRLIAIFREYGITGWRRNQQLVGKPDFTFRRERVVVFVDGCFWHGCPKCFKRPASNQKFWDTKIFANRKRDRYVNRELHNLGWQVVRIWEHQLVKSARVAGRVKSILISR
jgi:DNA mismatch endonuclease (patch repair protein)